MWLSSWIRQMTKKHQIGKKTEWMSGGKGQAVRLWAPPGDGKRELGGRGGKEVPSSPSPSPLTDL